MSRGSVIHGASKLNNTSITRLPIPEQFDGNPKWNLSDVSSIRPKFESFDEGGFNAQYERKGSQSSNGSQEIATLNVFNVFHPDLKPQNNIEPMNSASTPSFRSMERNLESAPSSIQHRSFMEGLQRNSEPPTNKGSDRTSTLQTACYPDIQVVISAKEDEISRLKAKLKEQEHLHQETVEKLKAESTSCGWKEMC